MTILAAMAGSLALLASSLMSPTPTPQSAMAGTSVTDAAPVVEIVEIRHGDNYRRHYGRRNGVRIGNPGYGIYLNLNRRDNYNYDCRFLRNKAVRTGSRYWRNRYYDCRNG
jgi:hypothetical protein